MRAEEENLVRFMGKIVASYTHEVKNVLSVISESNGLMQDLLGLETTENRPGKEKFERSVHLIEKNVSIGEELSTKLNQFAHSTDYPTSTVEVTEALRMLTILCRKIASRQQVVFQIAEPEQNIYCRTRHIELLAVIYYCMEALFPAAAKNSEITMTVGQDQTGVRLLLTCKSLKDSVESFADTVKSTESWELASEIIPPLQGALSVHEGETSIELLLPISLSEQ
jgi:hypothetical protein